MAKDRGVLALEGALAIDEHDLETSCREQPEIFYKVAKELALAISLRDEAHQLLKEAEAKADQEIREDSEANNEKVTETAVKNAVLLHKNVVKARAHFTVLSHEAGLLTALKEAFQQRSYALNHLVDMYLTRQRSEIERSSTVRDADAQLARSTLNQERRHGRR